MLNGPFAAQQVVCSIDSMLNNPVIINSQINNPPEIIKGLGAGLIIVLSPIIGGFVGACIDWVRKGDREVGRYKPRGNLFFTLGLAAGTAISISVLLSMTK